MHTTRRQLLALAASPLIPALPGCGGGGGGSAAAPAASDGRVVTLQVASTKVGYTYPVSVYVPASYDAATEPYPTIYANDGDAPFVANTTRFATLQNVLVARASKALLIGIGGYERRQTDYNFPGATAYHGFVTEELIPLVEAQFRCDPRRRMFTGLSTGGSFAATALFTEASAKLYFKVFLSVEAAFWQQLDLDNALEQQMASAVGSASLPVTLILAHCAVGTSGSNYSYVIDMYNRVASRRYSGLTLLETSFATNHVGSDVPAFDDAMSRMLL